MVIRRIREHVASHNWFAVGVDLAIVVVGVFLGTQANNWNEARLAASEEHTYRERLIEDVAANQFDFQARKAYYGDVRRHALAALQMFDSSKTKLGESFVVDAYQASQINALILRRSTYDELVASGALSRIGNQHLRDLAETYYQGLTVLVAENQRLPPYRERVRRELPYQVSSRIRERCGDRVSEMRGTIIFRLPGDCKLSLDERSVERAAVQLRAAPELDRDLSRYILDIDQRLDNFAGSERRSRLFVAALRQANAKR